jgi:hypothetical protein
VIHIEDLPRYNLCAEAGYNVGSTFSGRCRLAVPLEGGNRGGEAAWAAEVTV